MANRELTVAEDELEQADLAIGELVQGGFPRCARCKRAVLVPLSDFGGQGAAVHFKAWVCTDPTCLFNLKIRNGDVFIDEPVYDGREDRR